MYELRSPNNEALKSLNPLRQTATLLSTQLGTAARLHWRLESSTARKEYDLGLTGTAVLSIFCQVIGSSHVHLGPFVLTRGYAYSSVESAKFCGYRYA